MRDIEKHSPLNILSQVCPFALYRHSRAHGISSCVTCHAESAFVGKQQVEHVGWRKHGTRTGRAEGSLARRPGERRCSDPVGNLSPIQGRKGGTVLTVRTIKEDVSFLEFFHSHNYLQTFLEYLNIKLSRVFKHLNFHETA